jgi:hypothetical protein
MNTLIDGQTVKYDVEDSDIISVFPWRIGKSKRGRYLYYSVWHKLGVIRYLYHRMVIDIKDGYVVDHINGDTLDNRKENLRVCTIAQNAWNRKHYDNNTTGYKGVSVKNGKHGIRYQSHIRYCGHLIHIGTYSTAELASAAYVEYSKRIYGEFASDRFKGGV